MLVFCLCTNDTQASSARTGGDDWSFAEYGARSPKSCGRCYSVVGQQSWSLLCTPLRQGPFSRSAESHLGLVRWWSSLGKPGLPSMPTKYSLALSNMVLLEGVQTSGRVFASMTCFANNVHYEEPTSRGSQHNMINMQQMVHMKRISEWSERGKTPITVMMVLMLLRMPKLPSFQLRWSFANLETEASLQEVIDQCHVRAADETPERGCCNCRFTQIMQTTSPKAANPEPS